MTKSRRQIVLASTLSALLVVVLSWRVLGGPEAEVRRSPAATAAVPGSTAPEGTDPVADIRLELVRPAATGTPDADRNLFRFQPRVEPTPPRPVTPPAALAPAIPEGPPPPPPIPLRFIGLLDAPQSSGRIAILADGRGNVFNGKEGAVIEGRYRLLRVDGNTAELAYLDGRGRQTIRLSGQ